MKKADSKIILPDTLKIKLNCLICIVIAIYIYMAMNRWDKSYIGQRIKLQGRFGLKTIFNREVLESYNCHKFFDKIKILTNFFNNERLINHNNHYNLPKIYNWIILLTDMQVLLEV